MSKKTILKPSFQKPTAHQGGLLQWRAYRILESVLEVPLTKHRLSAPEWKLLGLLYDAGEMQATEIAMRMDVKLPLVTRNVGTLKAKNLILLNDHPEDKRIRIITVTPKGSERLIAVEKDVRKALGEVFQNVTRDEFTSYKGVLKKIIEQGGT